jgi:hypothetical protein
MRTVTTEAGIMTTVAGPHSVAVRASATQHWRGAARSTAARVAAMGGAAGALSLLQTLHPQQALVVCPLRTVTGIPCPLCGGTTAAISVARLDLVGALRANPVAVLGALAFALAPLGLLSLVGRRPSRRVSVWAIAAALAFAELWQLVRYDVLPI